tara:strand:+ start:988 stop:2145 length:1158 start_codon:yes stop_codon:yes gene_type:complete
VFDIGVTFSAEQRFGEPQSCCPATGGAVCFAAMKQTLKFGGALFCALAFSVGSVGAAKKSGGVAKASAAMASAANKFLTSLDAKQIAKAAYELKTDQRFKWHFIPTEMIKGGRTGLPMTEMNAQQKKAALGLVRSAMSNTGFQKAKDIMMLEGILRENEKNGRFDRNPIWYFVSIFGKPSAKGTWAWRFEGHHLSLAFTIVEGKVVVSTPSFMGSNPAKVLSGKRKGLRVLGPEEDLARDLAISLSDEQRKLGVIAGKAPRDILTSANRDAKMLKPKGVPFRNLGKEQKDLLRKLVSEYVGRNRAELAKADLSKIQAAGWNNVHFAWAGGFEMGRGHYYRVQGPSFIMEYANTQNKAYHVHATWREFDGDYGEDVLAKHFANDHN